ncbi:MAG: 3-methyladenine DNA glycosylase [Balneolaceae bacterium]|nr:3-methyladenine DNA glycosylase [Balneolaceae bacterium]MBO6546651.1 3-methyladenine DNA glycosylase [Balneolaceae bacterium]MBO6649009.1 3-methyladenine DNA glycosylase [Balneolaceae bacterium]
MITQSHITLQQVLTEQEWQIRKTNHEQRVDKLIGDYLKARSAHKKQPVMDFLFEYYAFRPSALRRWSPGLEVGLEVSDPNQLPELSELVMEDGVAFLNQDLFPEKRIKSTRWILEMLQNTQNKKPMFGCFGMHEWAMVYKVDKPRHDQVPLRMEPKELAEFVESRTLVCTHFDAYRFFTPEAVPMNKFELSRQDFANTEQPGCIHSNMDLYKWAHKLYPWIGSDLILEAFELACEARTIDMMASPYDLTDHGLEPIKIETESGRIEYLKVQESIFEKGKPVRESLINALSSLVI